MKMRNIFLTAGLAAALAGCGVQGPPQPPSLQLPKPVTDLAASRKGDKVTLTWTQPLETTDQLTVRHPGPFHICRTLTPATTPLTECGDPVASVEALPESPTGVAVQASYTDTLSSSAQNADPTGSAEYAVEAANLSGHSAGLSNQVTVPLAPILPPPTDLQAQVEADGVHISAAASAPPAIAGLKFSYRLYRAGVPLAPKEAPLVVAEVAATGTLEALDRSPAWEKRSAYRITAVTTIAAAQKAAAPTAIEGEDSSPVELTAHDVYPPAVPTGVQAVYSGLPKQNFIDLTWNPNSEGDFTGYNIYRHEAGAAPEKINPALLSTPAFRDANVAPGHTYFYSVSAQDVRGNESARSAETSEAVPSQ